MIFFSLLLYDRFLWYTAFLLFKVSSCKIFASISCRFPFLPDVLQIDKVPSHKIRAFRGKSVYTEFQSRTRFNFTEWTPKILPILNEECGKNIFVELTDSARSDIFVNAKGDDEWKKALNIRMKFEEKKVIFGNSQCAADFSLLNLPKGKSLGRSKPATNS